MTVTDFGVFLVATGVGPILIWVIRGGSVKVSALAVCALFGLGVAILNHVAGWI